MSDIPVIIPFTYNARIKEPRWHDYKDVIAGATTIVGVPLVDTQDTTYPISGTRDFCMIDGAFYRRGVAISQVLDKNANLVGGRATNPFARTSDDIVLGPFDKEVHPLSDRAEVLFSDRNERELAVIALAAQLRSVDDYLWEPISEPVLVASAGPKGLRGHFSLRLADARDVVATDACYSIANYDEAIAGVQWLAKKFGFAARIEAVHTDAPALFTFNERSYLVDRIIEHVEEVRSAFGELLTPEIASPLANLFDRVAADDLIEAEIITAADLLMGDTTEWNEYAHNSVSEVAAAELRHVRLPLWGHLIEREAQRIAHDVDMAALAL